MSTYISKGYIPERSSIKLKTFMHLNQQLQKLALEYYILMNLEEPSDSELNQLEEILKLGTIDEEVNDLLIKIDEHIAIEAGLIRDEVASKSWLASLASFITEEHFSQRNKKLVNLSLLSVMSVGTLLLLQQCESMQAKITYNTSFNYHQGAAPVQKNDTKQQKDVPLETSSIKADTARPNVPQNIVLLEKQLEYESKQIKYEHQQINFQRCQLSFEAKQRQAESKHLFEQAQQYLQQAQQCKKESKQSLSLSKEYEMKAEQSLSMAQEI